MSNHRHFYIREFGAEVLNTPAKDVLDFDEVLQEVVEEMFAICEKAGGVALAAPQVGLSKRIAVINAVKKTVLINPEIMLETGEQEEWEGCLSIPGFRLKVKRPLVVHVTFQNIKGEKDVLVASGLAARAVCHEVDHLNGKMLLSPTEFPVIQ